MCVMHALGCKYCWVDEQEQRLSRDRMEGNHIESSKTQLSVLICKDLRKKIKQSIGTELCETLVD